ncbi:MAG: IS110 family transposase [Kiritimatiellales bacterium]|nr:IS110 family transposase [Kiritimatiellales bacterium]
MQATKANELYAGADLHGNNVFLSVCDHDGGNVFRRRVKTNLAAVNAALDPFWDRIEVLGVESTFNWYWFVDGLREQGRNVKLGNPAKMEQYSGIKITNDLSDADWLAEQLRTGIFPECYIYPKETRAVRDALRRRQLFVRRRTQVILSLGGLLERYGLPSPSAAKVEKWTLADIQATHLNDWVQLQLESLLDAIRESDRLAKKIEKQVLAFVKPTEQYTRVTSLPGIGMALGLLIVLESGDFKRFASAGNYASYCRAVKSERTSNEKKKGSNNSKNGNKYLAWAFIEAATYAARFNPRIQSWYERKKKKSGVPKAKKALACKLAKAVWHVMNGEDFDEKLMFG